jgi:hypothetical protein
MVYRFIPMGIGILLVHGIQRAIRLRRLQASFYLTKYLMRRGN